MFLEGSESSRVGAPGILPFPIGKEWLQICQLHLIPASANPAKGAGLGESKIRRGSFTPDDSGRHGWTGSWVSDGDHRRAHRREDTGFHVGPPGSVKRRFVANGDPQVRSRHFLRIDARYSRVSYAGGARSRLCPLRRQVMISRWDAISRRFQGGRIPSTRRRALCGHHGCGRRWRCARPLPNLRARRVRPGRRRIRPAKIRRDCRIAPRRYHQCCVPWQEGPPWLRPRGDDDDVDVLGMLFLGLDPAHIFLSRGGTGFGQVRAALSSIPLRRRFFTGKVIHERGRRHRGDCDTAHR